MAMGQQKDRQGDLMVSWSEMPRSPGPVFYDRLQLLLVEADFDGFAEALCKPYYAARMGATSVPPGRYFRMHLVGYFEGIDSERGLVWRCSDSLSLREFLRLESRARASERRPPCTVPVEAPGRVADGPLQFPGPTYPPLPEGVAGGPLRLPGSNREWRSAHHRTTDRR